MADKIPRIDVDIRQGAKEDELEVTLRGEPSAIVQTLTSGLSRASLLQIHRALAVELAKRGLPSVHWSKR